MKVRGGGGGVGAHLHVKDFSIRGSFCMRGGGTQ